MRSKGKLLEKLFDLKQDGKILGYAHDRPLPNGERSNDLFIVSISQAETRMFNWAELDAFIDGVEIYS